jgi:DNA-directed DNA polymerase III PolC
MSIPISFFSDASLSMGNDIPSRMVEVAKKQGFKRTAIIDKDSMSSLIKYLDASKGLDVGNIVGVTLSVNIPKRDDLCWRIREESSLKTFSKALGVELLSSDFSYEIFHALKTTYSAFLTSLSDPTPGKIRNAIKKVASDNILSEIYVDGNSAEDLSDSHIKQIGAGEVLRQILSQIMPEGRNIWENEGSWSCLVATVKELNYDLPLSSLVFLASSSEGYKNLLSLASIKAKCKHDEINHEKSGPHALTIGDIKEYNEGVLVIDPLAPYSTLGGVSEQIKDTEIKQKAIDISVSSLTGIVDYLGIPYLAKNSLIEIAKNVNLPLVPMPTAHYAEEEDYAAFCVKVAVHNGQIVTDFTSTKPEPEKSIPQQDLVLHYFKSLKEELDALQLEFWDSKVKDTAVTLGEVFLPSYDMPVEDVIIHAYSLENQEKPEWDSERGMLSAFDDLISRDKPEDVTLTSYRQRKLNDYCLHLLTMKGLDERLVQQYGEDAEKYRKDYEERIAYEYDIIVSMRFPGYFLIQYDFVNFAREVGVPVGPGRGSAAGSLIVYCMEITDVDPIEYDLPFERFLNPERVSMPDIDVDFGDGGDVDRSTVLAYIKEKYQQIGAKFPSSSQIANIMRYQLKSSISAVRNAYGLSMTYDRELKNMIQVAEQTLGISSPKSISWKELLELDFIKKKIAKEPMLHRVLKMAKALTGKMSSYGVHAGGVVISPTVLTDFAPLACDDRGNYFAQFDKDDIERAGLIKFDVLGLKTLSVLSECERLIKKTQNKVVDFRKIDFKDPRVFALICERVLEDVFQLESRGMQELVGNLQPSTVGEIAVLSALFRPGALDSGMVDEYIEVKNGRQKPKYDHPAIEKVTSPTFGCIVYQEQVMSIVRELANYSLGQADLLRRAMGKKKAEEMEKQRDVYINSAMLYWRDYYIEIGQSKNLDFALDVRLSDIKDKLDEMSLNILNSEGVVASKDKVVTSLVQLLSLSDNQKNLLIQRLGDYSYVVSLFQQHYFDAITSAVNNKMSGDEEEKKAVGMRLYYALSQYVRFNQVFNKLEKFAGYGFNKSHAIAYSVVTYMTAYSKCYYPTEFYASALSSKDLDALHGTVLEAKSKMGIKIESPHINKSDVRFSVEARNTVRYGLEKLKSVGRSATTIYSEREANGFYSSLPDFLDRMYSKTHAPDSSAFKSLAVTGAFDDFIPSRILRHKDMNGRQFMIWMREQYVKSKWHEKQVSSDSLHLSVNDMSEVEFVAYLTAISPTATVKKVAAIIGDNLGDSEQELDEEVIKEVDRSFIALSKVPAKSKRMVIQEKALGLEQLSITQDYIETTQNNNESDFYWRYIYALVGISQDFEVYRDGWREYLLSVINIPATATLNEELEAAGFYMTTTPIRILKVAERVEREPPSSLIDGCPVSVGEIDGSYDSQNVTTYGIVRNMVVKTVKKETSSFFGEKMLFFDLESGYDSVSCMIFGDKPTNFFHNKVISNGCVALVAGEISVNDFGITLSPVAIKRYYPEVDEKVIPVRR